MTKVNNKKRKKNPALIWVMFVSQSYSILASYCFLMLHGFILFFIAIRITLHMLAHCLAQVKHVANGWKKLSENLSWAKYTRLHITKSQLTSKYNRVKHFLVPQYHQHGQVYLCRTYAVLPSFFVHWWYTSNVQVQKGYYTANKISH